MKEERAWRWAGLIFLVINWWLGLGMFSLSGLAAVILLTIAWRQRRKDPLLMTRLVPDLALAAFIGQITSSGLTSIYFRSTTHVSWQEIVPPLIYLGLAIVILVSARRLGARGETETGERPLFYWCLKYSMLANLLSMAVMSSWWIFLGVLVLSALYMAVWRFLAGRMALAVGVAVTSAAALAVMLSVGKPALVIQIGLSVIGLILSVLTELFCSAVRRHRSYESSSPGVPARWALPFVVGFAIGICGTSLIYKYLISDHLPVTTYTGAMETIQAGWLEFKVPEDSPAYSISIAAVWPEGRVSIHEGIFTNDKPHSEQFSENTERALGAKLWKKESEIGPENLKVMSSQLKDSKGEPSENLIKPTTAIEVDDHFGRPARLISGGDFSEIVLLVELDEGYLRFGYDPLMTYKDSGTSAKSDLENERWLIARARELINSYTWTGSQAVENLGFRTKYGLLKTGAEPGFDLYATINAFIGNDGYYLKFSSESKGYNYTRPGIIYTENSKRWQWRNAMRELTKGNLQRIRISRLTLAGASGTEYVALKRNLRKSGPQGALSIMWTRNSSTETGVDEVSMHCTRLEGNEDSAACLGLWEAVAASIHSRKGR
ncbi:hypothetical protein C4J81_10415 [Deltaproteobacteria bacterium Smac51]|nr:hypothetical protein C4J81_10415 [Deltaproteobacteria bacterium Smac51]